MKNTVMRGAALALVAALSIGAAQAATFDGSLFIGGEVEPVPGPTLGDAVGLSFTDGLLVTGSSGQFATAGIGFGDTGVINDFLFSDMPIDPFVSVGGAVITLNSIASVEQSEDFLNLTALGVATLPGFDPTPILFALSADGAGTNFSYSASFQTDFVVPLPGALVLFASGLAAIGFRRRS